MLAASSQSNKNIKLLEAQIGKSNINLKSNLKDGIHSNTRSNKNLPEPGQIITKPKNQGYVRRSRASNSHFSVNQ